MRREAARDHENVTRLQRIEYALCLDMRGRIATTACGTAIGGGAMVALSIFMHKSILTSIANFIPGGLCGLVGCLFCPMCWYTCCGAEHYEAVINAGMFSLVRSRPTARRMTDEHTPLNANS